MTASSSTSQPPTQTGGGFFASLGSSALYPARRSGAALGEGAINGVATYLSSTTNNQQLAETVRRLLSQALVTDAPEALNRLQERIAEFRSGINPTQIRRLTRRLQKVQEHPSLGLTEQERLPLTALHTALTTQDYTHLNERLTAVEQLIEGKKGAIRQFVEFADRSLLHPGSGLLSRLIEQVKGELVSDHDSLINELTKTLRQSLTAQPSTELKACVKALKKFRERCRTDVPKQEIAELWSVCDECLKGLPSKTFSRETWRKISDDASAIHKWLASSSDFPENITLIDIVERTYQARQGLVDQAAETLLSKVEPLLDRIERLPAQMIANVVGGNPSTPVPAPSSSSEPAEKPTFVDTLRNTAGSILSRAKDELGSKMMQATLHGLSSLMNFAFRKARETLEKDGQHQFIYNKIDPLLDEIQRLQKEESWEQLTHTLQEARDVMEEQVTIFQGIRLPFNSKRTHRTSAIPEFLNHIDRHRHALHKKTANKPKKVTAAMIERETSKLKLRAAAYLPIKLISEWVCNLNGSDQFYASILHIPDNLSANEWEAEFRTRFYAEIDRADLFFLRKWTGKTLYFCTIPICNFFSDAFIENTISSFQNWNRTEDPENPKDTTLIRLFRNWLAILSSAYTQAAERPAKKSKDLRQMLYEALHHPSHNHGLKPTEIYAAFAKSAMDTFGPRFQWRKTACSIFTKEIPRDSFLYFLDPTSKFLQTVARYTLNAALFIPEWTCNKVLHGVSKLFLNYNTLLQDKVESAINSLSHNTPTAYYLNQAILQQLQKVRIAIQENLTDKPSKKGKVPTFQSRSKKRELADLLEYLFEVLHKSRYNTQDKLRRYLKGDRTLLENIEREVESLFLPKSLETAVEILTTAMETLEPDDLLYNCLTIANSTFEPPVSISKKEFAGLESGISEIVGQILESSIFYALDNAFDFEGKKEKKGIDRFFRGLKRNVLSCTRTMRSRLQGDSRGKATSVIKEAIRLHQNQVDRLAQVDGNSNFHTQTKQKLNDVSMQLIERWKTLGTYLNKLAPSQEMLDQLTHSEKVLKQCKEHVGTLVEYLIDHPTRKDRISSIRLELGKFTHSIQKYEECRHSKTVLKELRSVQTELQTAICEIDTLTSDYNTLQEALPHLRRIKKAQQTALWKGASEEPQQHAKKLKQVMKRLSSSTEMDSIISKITPLLKAPSTQLINTTHRSIKEHLITLINRKDELIRSDLPNLQRISKRLQRSIRTKQAESKNKSARIQQRMEKHIHIIHRELDQLDHFVEDLHNIPILSLLPFDMQWVNDTSQQIAYDLANAKVQQLLIALYQKHNYASAINQLLIHPFLETHGKHHLKDAK